MRSAGVVAALLLVGACGKTREERTRVPPEVPALPADPTPEPADMEARIESFWRWFAAHAAELADLAKTAPVEAMQRLGTQIEGIAAGAGPEVGAELVTSTSPGPLTLVITANGMRDAAPLAKRIVAAAPSVARWTVRAFRPRMPPDGPLSQTALAGSTFTFADVRIVAQSMGAFFDVVLYIPGASDEATRERIGFIVLDSYLGELDVMEKIGEISALPIDQAPANAITPSELVKLVDGLPSTP